MSSDSSPRPSGGESVRTSAPCSVSSGSGSAADVRGCRRGGIRRSERRARRTLALSRPRRTTSQPLADQRGITKQSVNDLLGHLERHGYLVREPDSADGRARVIRLTSKGRRLEQTIYAQAGAAQLGIAEILGPRASPSCAAPSSRWPSSFPRHRPSPDAGRWSPILTSVRDRATPGAAG